MTIVYGRSPLEIRDDMIEMLFEEFYVELDQLNITLDAMLELDDYEIVDVKRKVWAQVRINDRKKAIADERYRWRMHYSNMGVLNF